MIRDYIETDYEQVNNIGKLIKNEFENVYKIDEFIQNEYAHIIVYVLNDKVVGFLQYEDHFEITDIINIAVDKENQGNSIGEKLINYLIDNTHADKIMLEVRDDNNPAIRLYDKCGFKEIHRRIKYYGDVDAIIMERRITHE